MEFFVIFSPLVGAILAGFGWKIIGEKVALILATSLLFLACFVSWFLFLDFLVLLLLLLPPVKDE